MHPWTGPLASVGLVALLALAGRWPGYRIPNPNLLFAMVIVVAAYMGGIASGLASAAIAIAFTAYDWAIPGHPLNYAPENLQRLIVALACLPGMAIVVGMLKVRADSRQRTIIRYLALEQERNRELARALAHPDIPEGSIPVCAWCHRIRKGDGTWESLEAHLAGRYGAVITHGICPECRPALVENIPNPVIF